MLYRFLSKNLQSLIKQRNGFLVLSLGLLLCNVLLGTLLFFKNERIIVVPAYLKQSFWNEGSTVSNSYIEEMSLFFTNLMLNTTPDSHKYRRDVILRYVAPESYHIFEKKLIEDEELMSKNAVTTQFAAREVKVN
ncbi:conjugal transfer pilus assembly protein TraE [Alphaproteobacteria bacterium]